MSVDYISKKIIRHVNKCLDDRKHIWEVTFQYETELEAVSFHQRVRGGGGMGENLIVNLQRHRTLRQKVSGWEVMQLAFASMQMSQLTQDII